MKLPLPTANEIFAIAERAEDAMRNTNSRSCHKLIIENAIRNALDIVVGRLNIQVPDTLTIDLSKP